MDDSFVREIVKQSAPTLLKVGDLEFCDRTLEAVDADRRPTVLAVATLMSIKDYMTANVDKVEKPTLLLHVESPELVSLISEVGGPMRKRTTWLQAKLPEKLFPFGQFFEAELFVIALQTMFEKTPDLEKIQKLAGNVKSEQVITFADNGITQHVTARTGAATVEDVEVPNPVTLKPFRTFREVQQTESSFVFRVRDGGNQKPPGFALIEADGGAWKLAAIEAVKDWLTKNVPGVAVIG